MDKIVRLFLIISVLFTISCNDDSVSSPDTESYNLTITGLPDELTAPYGSTQDIEFVVSIFEEDGLPASDVDVSIYVDDEIGTVSPANATTDENGQVQAIHTVTMWYSNQTVRIIAAANNDTVTTSYTLIGENPPKVLRLIPQFTEIAVPDGGSCRIELNAIVGDSACHAMEGVKVRFHLKQYNDESQVFGSISGESLTDPIGRATAEFSSESNHGTVFAQVLIGEGDVPDLKAQVPLTIRRLEEEIHYLNISAYPRDYQDVHQDALLTTQIMVTVQDREHRGIPNLHVRMSADIGVLSQPTLTDHNGTIRVYHRLIPSIHVPDFNGDFTATISAELEELGLTNSTSILFSPRSQRLSVLTLDTDRLFIWADGVGLSFANLTATLTEGGKGIPNAEIEFTSSFRWSVVQSPIITDNDGIAKTVFDDMGRPSDRFMGPDSVLITAKYPPYGLEATTRILISDNYPVSHINLFVGARSLVAGSGTRTPVRAYVFLSSGSQAPIGTEVFFTSLLGTYSDYMVRTEGPSRVAETYYIAGNQVDTDTLAAWVRDPVNGRVYSNKKTVDLVPGSPEKMRHQDDELGYESENLTPIRNRSTEQK